MKILIACDMEGISGVVSWNQVNPTDPEYQRFRHVMTADVNAAIKGAFTAGATEVTVTDGHWNSSNILIEELDPRASLNAGTPSAFSMVQGVDQGMDAAIFLGYHARVGTQNAVLDHTWSSMRVSNLWLNGRLTGEFGLNGSLAGSFGVPVIMVTGDQSVCAEAREWVPDVMTAQVKQASGRTSALCLSLEKSQALIQQTAEKAVRRVCEGNAPAPIQMEMPVTVTIEYLNSLMGDAAALLPGSRRLDGRRIEFSAASMPEAYSRFRAAINLVSV